MTVKLPASQSLPRRWMAAFRLRRIQPLLAELAPRSHTRLAQNRPPQARQAGGNSC